MTLPIGYFIGLLPYALIALVIAYIIYTAYQWITAPVPRGVEYPYWIEVEMLDTMLPPPDPPMLCHASYKTNDWIEVQQIPVSDIPQLKDELEKGIKAMAEELRKRGLSRVAEYAEKEMKNMTLYLLLSWKLQTAIYLFSPVPPSRLLYAEHTELFGRRRVYHIKLAVRRMPIETRWECEVYPNSLVAIPLILPEVYKEQAEAVQAVKACCELLAYLTPGIQKLVNELGQLKKIQAQRDIAEAKMKAMEQILGQVLKEYEELAYKYNDLLAKYKALAGRLPPGHEEKVSTRPKTVEAIKEKVTNIVQKLPVIGAGKSEEETKTAAAVAQ